MVSELAGLGFSLKSLLLVPLGFTDQQKCNTLFLPEYFVTFKFEWTSQIAWKALFLPILAVVEVQLHQGQGYQ